MTVQTQTPARHATRLTLALAAIAGLILSLFFALSPTFATHVTPTFVNSENANSCQDLGFPAGTAGWNLSAGSINGDGAFHTYVNGAWSIDIKSDASKTHFDFQNAAPPVLKIAVKAGDGYYLYDYTPGGATADTGLITPNTGGNAPGQPQAGLSHFFLCFGAASQSQAPSVPASVEQSQAASQAASRSPEGTQLGGTGTPAPSLPNTALGLAGSGPLATIFFGAVLIASLGALAYANVAAVRRRR